MASQVKKVKRVVRIKKKPSFSPLTKYLFTMVFLLSTFLGAIQVANWLNTIEVKIIIKKN